eukprot:376785-Amphidinium_carterae.3
MIGEADEDDDDDADKDKAEAKDGKETADGAKEAAAKEKEEVSEMTAPVAHWLLFLWCSHRIEIFVVFGVGLLAQAVEEEPNEDVVAVLETLITELFPLETPTEALARLRRHVWCKSQECINAQNIFGTHSRTQPKEVYPKTCNRITPLLVLAGLLRSIIFVRIGVGAVMAVAHRNALKEST